MNKAKDAVQHYTKTYAKKDNIEQGRGKAGSDTVYNTEVKRPPKRGTQQEKERNIVTDRTTYNPKTGNITESIIGQPNLDYRHADSKEKKIKGGYPRTKKEYGYNEATKSLIDQLLEKAITRPVGKMSNKEVDAYLGRKDKEAMSAPDTAIPEVTDEEKKVRALDEKRAIKFEQQGKSMDDRTLDWLAKCHSHVLQSETEESVKKKKKQPEKADGHVLGTDPAIRAEHEMVAVKEPDAWKSAGERTREEQNRLKQQRLHDKVEGDNSYKQYLKDKKQWRANNPKDVAPPHSPYGWEKSIVSVVDELMVKAKVNRMDYDEDGMPQTAEAQKEFDEIGRRNAAMHAGIKPKVPKGVKPQKGEEVEKAYGDKLKESEARKRTRLIHGTTSEWSKYKAEADSNKREMEEKERSQKSMIAVVDELMVKARVAASKVRSVKLSPEREKEILERHDKKVKALKQSSYKPDYSRYAERIYREEGGEKSLDQRTCDLFKDRESRKEIADAVRAVRLHREGMHKEAKQINPNPEKLITAARKHNAMIASAYREKSILNTWKEGSSMITKGSRVLPIGPGGEIQNLSKNGEPSYNEIEKKQEDVMSGRVERERKAKKRIEQDKDISAE